MEYIIFTRRSVADNAETSHGMQLHECLKTVGTYKYRHVEEEGKSRDTPLERRPQLLKAISMLKPGSVLLVWRLDRLCAGETLGQIIHMVARKNATIQSHSQPNIFEEGIHAELMRVIINAVGTYELKNIRARVKCAMDELKRNGRCAGHVPYGFKRDPERICPKLKKPAWVILDEEEQKNIEIMHRLYYEDGLTLREVADRLNSMGLLNRGGRLWLKDSVYRILKNRGNYECYYREKVPESLPVS